MCPESRYKRNLVEQKHWHEQEFCNLHHGPLAPELGAQLHVQGQLLLGGVPPQLLAGLHVGGQVPGSRTRDIHEDGEALLLAEQAGLRRPRRKLSGRQGQVSRHRIKTVVSK
jgi:hypothetical protein